jgi:hypothetical protein
MNGYGMALVLYLWAQPAFLENFNRQLVDETCELDTRCQSGFTEAVQCDFLTGDYISSHTLL